VSHSPHKNVRLTVQDYAPSGKTAGHPALLQKKSNDLHCPTLAEIFLFYAGSVEVVGQSNHVLPEMSTIYTGETKGQLTHTPTLAQSTLCDLRECKGAIGPATQHVVRSQVRGETLSILESPSSITRSLTIPSSLHLKKEIKYYPSA